MISKSRSWLSGGPENRRSVAPGVISNFPSRTTRVSYTINSMVYLMYEQIHRIVLGLNVLISSLWSLASHGSWCRSGEDGPGGLVLVTQLGSERRGRRVAEVP